MSEQSPQHTPPVEADFPWTPFKDEELDQSIPERFERQAQAFPERLAIRSRVRSFTYDRLNRTANRRARTILSMRGEGAETVALLIYMSGSKGKPKGVMRAHRNVLLEVRNLTNRQFTVDGQNPLRVANMTNRPTSCRFIYLAMAGDARAVSAA